MIDTIGENIARFQPDAAPEAIHAAAVAAGAFQLIAQLGGFDARVGDGGAALSAGQRQRIGLARALFGEESAGAGAAGAGAAAPACARPMHFWCLRM